MADDLEQYVQDSLYFQQRLRLARRATDLAASEQFNLARSALSDAELLAVTKSFGRDTSSSGWGFAPVLDHLLSREPEKVPVADLKQLQTNLKKQGYAPAEAEPTGEWDSSRNTSFYRWDQDQREAQMGGSSWGAAPVRAGIEVLTNTIPSRVFQALVGGAKGFVEQTPETVERVGLLGGAAAGATLGATAGAFGGPLAPFTATAGAVGGAIIGGAVGFLTDLFTDDEREGDQSMAERFVDALSPYEEYVATRDGVKGFWEDVGWVMTAGSLVVGAGMLGKALAPAAEFAAAAPGSAGMTLSRALPGSNQLGMFGRMSQRALAAATGPEFSEALITSMKAATMLANRLYTPFSVTAMGARYGGGFGSGESRTTIEESIEEAPELPGFVDLASFVIVPQQFFPVRFGQLRSGAASLLGLGRAAERAIGDASLQPVIGAIQRAERVGFAEAKAKALSYLGENDIERALSYARLTMEAGVDTLARERVARLGMDGTEAVIEHAWSAAKADIMTRLRAGEAGLLDEVIGRVTGLNRAALEGWLVRNAAKGSGVERMGDFLEATRLGERVTADIQLGRVPEETLILSEGRMPNTAEAWKRLEGKSTIRQLRAEARELQSQAARAKNPDEMATLKGAATQKLEQAKELETNLPSVALAEGRGVENVAIVPARLDTLTSPQLHAYAREYRRLRDDVLGAMKAGTNAEIAARMELTQLVDDLERRHVIPSSVAARAKQPKPAPSVAKHIEDRARYAAGEVTLPTDVADEFARLGYKPVAVSGGLFSLDEAQKVASQMGAPVYKTAARWVETLGLSPLKQNDDAIFDLMRANQEYEVGRVVDTVSELNQVSGGIEGLTGAEVISRLQSVIAKEKGVGASVGGLSIGKAPLVDIRQLTPGRILETFEEDFPEMTLEVAEKIFKAIKKGRAFGADVKLLHPTDAVRALGEAMRVNGLPGFSDVVRGYALPGRRKLVLGGAAVGGATGAIVGDEKLEDAAKGAVLGGLTGLAGAMAAWSKKGYGYLPDRLARLHNALRYSLSPTFDAGRYVEQNMIAHAKHGLPPIWKPRDYITRHYGADGWQEALGLWDEVTGAKGLIRNIDDLDRRMNQVGILGFSPRNFEAAQAYMLAQRGMAKSAIKEAVYDIGRYGVGRTGFEKSVNFVFFPFSYVKKLYSAAGDYALQHPAMRLLLHEGMRLYYLHKFDEKFNELVEEHAPILKQFQRVSNFGYGISPGRFFLEGLADNESNLGKASQVLASFFVPSGAAQPVARVAGEAGDLAMHLFVPVVATGADIKRIGGPDQLQATLESYLPLYRDLFGPSGLVETAKDQTYALLYGETPRAQEQHYLDQVRLIRDEFDELAEALGYASADSLFDSNPAYGAAFESRRRELADRYPIGHRMSQSFENTQELNEQELYKLARQADRSEAEDLILQMKATEAGGDVLVEMGIPRDLVDAMTADKLRREALLHVRDREFAALWRRFFSYQYGPLEAAA